MAYRLRWTCLVVAVVLTAGGLATADDLPKHWEAEPHKRALYLDSYFASLENSDDPSIRSGILPELSRVGGERGLRAICKALGDEAPEVRGSAARELGGLTPWPMTHAVMLPALLRGVREERDLPTLDMILDALGGIIGVGGHNAAIAEALTDRLERTMASAGLELFLARGLSRGRGAGFVRERVSYELIRYLGYLGPDAGRALPAIRKLTGSPVPSLALWARYALIKIAGPAPEHLAAIEAGLRRGRSPKERCAAADVLGWLGPDARPCVRALVEALQDEEVWACAGLALGKIGSAGEEGVEALAQMARDDSRSLTARVIAVRCMGDLRAEREIVWPILMGILRDENSPLRGVAAWELGDLGVATDAVVDALLDATQATDRGVRRCAASALGELAVRPDAVVPVLVGLLQDESWEVRFATVNAVGNYPKHVDRSLDPMTKLLRMEHEHLQETQAVVRCLERLGPAARPAAAHLVALRQSCEESIASTPPFFIDEMWPQLIGDIDQALESIDASPPAGSD